MRWDASNFNSLQRVQNTLAHVVLWRRKLEHTIPSFIDLHRLPIQYHVIYRLTTPTYRIKHMDDRHTYDYFKTTNPVRPTVCVLPLVTWLRLTRTQLFHPAPLDFLLLPIGTVHHLIFVTVKLLLLLTVNLRHSSLKPLPSHSHSRGASAYKYHCATIWCVKRFILLTILLSAP